MATIRKRNNTYLITVSCGYDITGKQIRRTMTYKPEPGMNQRQVDKEVQRQAVLFEEDCQKGKILKGNIKLADFIELYFENYAEVTLKKRTVFGYRAHVPYVNQALGHLRIDRIQPHNLNEFYKQLSTVGSRKKDVYKPLTDFRALLKDKGVTIAQAARDCEVKENTLRGVMNNKPVYKPTAQALCKYLKLDKKKVFEKEEKAIFLEDDNLPEPSFFRYCETMLNKIDILKNKKIPKLSVFSIWLGDIYDRLQNTFGFINTIIIIILFIIIINFNYILIHP